MTPVAAHLIASETHKIHAKGVRYRQHKIFQVLWTKFFFACFSLRRSFWLSILDFVNFHKMSSLVETPLDRRLNGNN